MKALKLFQAIFSGTNPITLEDTVYDDLQVTISNVKVPVANYPNERLYAGGVGGGITFPFLGFALNDYIYFDVQSSHAMKLSTVLDCHIHFTVPNTTNIGDKFKFQLDVLAAPITGTWAVPTGSPYSGEYTIATGDDTKHNIKDIADIAAVNTGVSIVYKCKLTRVAASANEYSSEVYVTFIDCHYQIDRLGSKDETGQ